MKNCKKWWGADVFSPVLKILLTMKLIVLLICGLGLLSSMAGKSYAQSARLTFALKDVSIKSVLKHIEYNSEFSFMYDNNEIDANRKVNIEVKDETIETILNRLFGNETDYRIIDRHIILFPGEKHRPGDSNNYMRKQQVQQKVSGKVTDSSGLPLPGVTVIIKGSAQGTVTNADGDYTLTNIPEDATLVFSFVGMKTQEIPVAANTSINVIMFEEAIGIDEVVAIGYGTVMRSDLTGSVASVKSEELKNTPITNISQTLQGRVAGVNVRQSQTSPGGDITVRVRGISTFMGETKPLYVIDGIIGGDINTINPTDIESIEILKDASSTSIYGANGANGVILITTKSGKEGKNRIHFDGHFGVQQVTRTLDLLNAKEWAEIDNYRNELLGYEYRWDLNNLPGNTDWQKELYQIAPIVNLNLSSSGGNASLNYFTSLDYINQSGILENTGYERANFRLNLDADINERIKIGSRIGAMRSNRNKMMEEGNYSERSSVLETALMPPILNPYDESGNLQPNLSWTGSDGTPITVSNPLHFQKNLVDKAKRTGISGSIFTKIELIKGLTFRPSFNFNFHSEENGYYKSSKMYDVSDEFRNSASLGYLDNTRINSDILIDYAKTFNNHEIQLLGGFIVTSSRLESILASVDDFALDNFLYHSLNSGETWRAINSNLVEKKGIGYISRVNYNFKQKYYLSYRLSYDGSSVMGQNYKWGFFPYGAVMWLLFVKVFL
nr:SusC/RagA family TonB-linked outer membrane protein [Sunxiuqinia sp.]